MNLELNHLINYLPYKLHFKEEEHIWLLYALQENYEFPINGVSKLSDIQPILKPLSDLCPDVTDELIENAECDAEIDFINALLEDKNSMYDKIKFAPFSIIQRLCELHFDIFGLIEKRLAVNYHSVYKA